MTKALTGRLGVPCKLWLAVNALRELPALHTSTFFVITADAWSDVETEWPLLAVYADVHSGVDISAPAVCCLHIPLAV